MLNEKNHLLPRHVRRVPDDTPGRTFQGERVVRRVDRVLPSFLQLRNQVQPDRHLVASKMMHHARAQTYNCIKPLKNTLNTAFKLVYS